MMLVPTSLGVCSAHAEVIRQLLYRQHTRIRLLRTRGGDPTAYSLLNVWDGSAPHTRR